MGPRIPMTDWTANREKKKKVFSFIILFLGNVSMSHEGYEPHVCHVHLQTGSSPGEAQ